MATPNKSIIHRFATIDKLLAHLKAAYGSDLTRSRHQGGTDWTNGETIQDSMSLAIRGTTDYHKQVEEELAKLGEVKTPAGERMDMDVVGSTCSPGAYISGHPRCMWRQQESAQPEPVRIHVMANASAAVSAEAFAKRGAMIVALLRKLENIVPVELWIVFSTPFAPYDNASNTSFMFKAQTNPLDVRRLAYQLASIGFFRNIGASIVETEPSKPVSFGPCAKYNGRFGYMNGSMMARRKHIAGYKEAHNLTDRDIVFPRMTPDEGCYVMQTDINKWLHEIAQSVAGMDVSGK